MNNLSKEEYSVLWDKHLDECRDRMVARKLAEALARIKQETTTEENE